MIELMILFNFTASPGRGEIGHRYRSGCRGSGPWWCNRFDTIGPGLGAGGMKYGGGRRRLSEFHLLYNFTAITASPGGTEIGPSASVWVPREWSMVV